MAWIKNNLFWVVFGVIALSLMGLAGYFLYSNIQRNDEVKLQLQTQVQSLAELSLTEPFPNASTLAGIAADQVRVQQVLSDSRKAFQFNPKPALLDDRGFKLMLEKTIADLKQEATAAGVGLPSESYSFGFAIQRPLLQYKPGAVEPWSVQLGDIRDLFRVLYRSKVMAVQGVRRAPFFPFDLGGPDTMGMLTATNQSSGTTYFPYEITFRGFTADIANVLDELQKATNCYVVKMINIEPSAIGIPAYNPALAAAVAAAAAVGGASGSATTPARPTRPVDVYAERYGNTAAPPPKPVGPQPVIVRPVAPTTPQLSTVLSEKPLRVSMLVVVVRIKDSKATDEDKGGKVEKAGKANKVLKDDKGTK